MANPIRALRAKLRDFALTLPDVREDMPWGERVLKVNNKVFVFLGKDMDPDQFGLSVKLPESHKGALRMPFAEPTGYNLGKSGWVTAKLDDQSQASFEMLRDWVRESYCAVAPKGLSERVRGERELAKVAKKAKTQAKTQAKRVKTGSRRAKR